MVSLPLLEATVRRLMGRPRSPQGSDSLWVYDRAPSEGGRTTPRAVRDQHQTLQPMRGLLTDAEIVRALRRFRYDPEFRGPKRVPMRVLADLISVSRMTIYRVMRPDLRTRPKRMISERTRAKLSPAIAAILDGRLRFRRMKHVWEIEGSMLRPQRQLGGHPDKSRG